MAKCSIVSQGITVLYKQQSRHVLLIHFTFYVNKVTLLYNKIKSLLLLLLLLL